jgi:nucleoside phosphorylase
VSQETQSNPQAISQQRPIALIVCALQLEFRAVVHHLVDRREILDHIENVYEFGRFDGGNVSWDVAVVECGQGNLAASQAVNAGIVHFQPDVVIFAGVAGSLKGDIPLGHVVASTKIISYVSGKAGAEFFPRFNVENSHHGLVQRAKATARCEKWLQRIREPGRLGTTTPGATPGPIAAGEHVVASDQSATFELLKRECSDALAVEMEGYGTVLASRTNGVPAIVVRAISDNVVDKSACDAKGWQPVAADHASAFLFEMLANYRPRIPFVGFRLTIADSVDAKDIQPADGKIKSLFDSVKAMSTALLGWRTTLTSGHWIERPEKARLLSTLKELTTSTTVLLGAPGAGKSALLSQIGREVGREHVQVFAIKADFIDTAVKTPSDLASFLGLPYEADKCIKILAGLGPVVVLIDQLDALASLLDLRSQRLNVLLNLIREVAGVENVHIICSSRKFEYEHDVRLATINAEVVDLELPSVDFIAGLLKSHYEINSANWPDRLRETLRVPQHLNFFLSHLKGANEHHVASSYQQMLDEIWQRTIANEEGPAGRSELLMEMAQKIASEETLWLPIAQFENRQQLVTILEAAEFLHRPAGRGTVGFRHQTIFEHALARAYATGNAKLSEHVLQRQSALFVRPILWTTLRYLREVSPKQYNRELSILCDAELRLHITYLLIEFVGQVTEPTEQELEHLQRWLEQPRFLSKVLVSIAGNGGWFQLLRNGILPALMQLPVEDSWSISHFLRSAWRVDRDAILSLVREFWLPHKEKDRLIINTFQELTIWDEETVFDLCKVIDRTDMHIYHIMDVASSISAQIPELAPRIIAARLKRDLRLVRQKPVPVLPPLPADESLVDLAIRLLENGNRKDYEELLNRDDGFYELSAIAEAAPGSFLREVWPWFVEILERLLQPAHHIINRYREYFGWRLDFDSERPMTNEILLAIKNAIFELAKTNVEEFLQFAKKWGTFDAKPVQQLLCRGFIAVADQLPEAALEFLIADPRRLLLGESEDRMADSRALIRAVAVHLDNEKLKHLEDAIISWSEYVPDIAAEDASTRFQRKIWDRELRLRLLKTLPFDRASESTQRLIRSEEIALPGYHDYDHKPTRMTFIGSPMSVDQMEQAPDDQLLNLFDELDDDTEAEHPRDFMRGGTVQASQALAALAERDPERVARLLRQFRPDDQQTPIANSIRALGSNSHYSTADLFQLIFDLDHAGVRGSDFRAEAAQALFTRANDETGLPNSICLLLETWLSSWTDWNYFRDEQDSEQDENENSGRGILWNREGYIYPHGSYWLIHALTYGYLRQTPPNYGSWMRVLERHLDRPESAYTWKILTEDLKYLRNCDAARASAFVTRLFEEFPKVRDSRFGLILLTRSRFFLPDDSVKAILVNIRDSGWRLGGQAYGELIGMSYIFGERLDWIGDETTRCIQEPQIAIGIAFAAANLMWEDVTARKRALMLFDGLIKTSSPEIDKALMSTFSLREGMPVDPGSKQLLELINDEPRLLDAAHEHWFVEKLEDVVTYCPQLVCDICDKMVAHWAEDLANVATRTSLASSNLVNIAMTLQRLPKYRERGLNLFERLLELGVYDAARLLIDLDSRPVNVPQPPRTRRKRR